MKNKLTVLTSCLLMTVLCLCLFACGGNVADKDVWAEAIYTSDTELGEGEKTVMVEVVAIDKSVTLTLHSDKETLGEALSEHNLVEGEDGAYGLYVKKVNGIVADYDENQCYWGFNKNGEGMTTGVDGAVFEDGDHYELVYTSL